MSDKSNQNISELMDGELEKDCSRFLLKRMQSDEQLGAKWDNYHLMRSYLQQDKDAPLMNDMGAQVVATLSQQQQPTVESEPTQGLRSKWLKPFLGSAIAASVAWVAVIGLIDPLKSDDQGLLNETVMFKTAEQLIDPPNAQHARVEQQPVYTRYPSLTPTVQQYIIDSNIKHAESLPQYYNIEYMRQLQNQTLVIQKKQVAE